MNEHTHPFRNVFLHRIGIMEVMADYPEDIPYQTIRGNFLWACNHLVAQRERLKNQQDTIEKLRAENAKLADTISYQEWALADSNNF